MFFVELDQTGVGGVFEQVDPSDALLDQSLPSAQQLQGPGVSGRHGRCRGWLQALSIVGDEGGVDAVGLGALAAGLGKGAHPHRVDDRDGHPGTVGHGGQEFFVASAGFKHQMGSGRELS